MNKKQRNRKLVAQNKRNRIINRRYSSTIKTLSKLFFVKIEKQEKNGIQNIKNKLFSIIDKATKKKYYIKIQHQEKNQKLLNFTKNRNKIEKHIFSLNSSV